jgi:hypothetical protein
MSRVCLPDGSSEVDDTGSSSIDILDKFSHWPVELTLFRLPTSQHDDGCLPVTEESVGSIRESRANSMGLFILPSQALPLPRDEALSDVLAMLCWRSTAGRIPPTKGGPAQNGAGRTPGLAFCILWVLPPPFDGILEAASIFLVWKFTNPEEENTAQTSSGHAASISFSTRTTASA